MPRHRLTKDYYVHVGDANHRPMATLHEVSREGACSIVEEALEGGWPVRVTFASSNVSGEDFIKMCGKS